VVLGGGVCVDGRGVAVAGGGVADAGGGVTAAGGAVVGRVACVLLGLLIAPGVVPGVLSGGQLAVATAPEDGLAWPVGLAAAAVFVPSTQGLISGTDPGVAEGPGVAVGSVPGTVVCALAVVPDCMPVFVPIVPGWLPVCEPAGALLVVWAISRPASARIKLPIRGSLRMRCLLR
jgi:hypothetical protein